MSSNSEAWAAVPPHIGDCFRSMISGQVSDAPATQRIVVGYASVTHTGNGDVVVDSYGDVIDMESLKEAVESEMDEVPLYYRHGKDAERVEIGEIIEHYVLTPERKAALGLPGDTAVGYLIAAHVTDEQSWQETLAGELPMFSIGALTAYSYEETDDTLFDWLRANAGGAALDAGIEGNTHFAP